MFEWVRLWRLRRRAARLQREERRSAPTVSITATGANVIAANVIHGDVVITNGRVMQAGDNESDNGH